MRNLKNVSHLFCWCTLWDPEKLIKIKWWGNYIFNNAIILSFPTFITSPITPRFINIHNINKQFRNIWSINNSIPHTAINRFNKNPHSNFPQLIVQSTKHRWPYEWKHPQQKEVYFRPFRINLNNFQEPALDTNCWKLRWPIFKRGELNNLYFLKTWKFEWDLLCHTKTTSWIHKQLVKNTVQCIKPVKIAC